MFNQTNETSSDDISPTFKAVLLSILVVIALGGLIGYAAYVYVILRNWQVFNNAFYVFTVSLAIPDCLNSVLVLIFTLPSIILAPKQERIPSWAGWTASFLYDYIWFNLLAHMVVIATTRLISIKWSLSYIAFFSKWRVKVFVAVCYLVALVVPIFRYSCACATFHYSLAGSIGCRDDSRCHNVVNLIDNCVSNSQILFVVLCNAITLVQVCRLGRKIHEEGDTIGIDQIKRERVVMMQFSAIAFVLMAEAATYQILNIVPQGSSYSPITGEAILIATTAITCSLNPFLYFVFSTEAKEKLRGTFSVTQRVTVS